MRKLILPLLVICSAIMIIVTSVQAQMATRNEALTVATNWITMVIQKRGDWGGSKTAKIAEVQEFKRGEKFLGYFFHVNPKGYIIVPVRKEMAPVKAYSATSDLDPKSEEGMADLLKGQMERILDKIEQVIGSEKSGETENLTDSLEIDYRPAWEDLLGDVKIIQEELKSDEGSLEMGSEIVRDEGNYQEGQWLLSSNWDQKNPYNNDCPYLGCSENTNGRAVVGCVATAGAQVMRYWNWPPHNESGEIYDWLNMPDTATTSSPQPQIDAVAKLCYEVGVEAGMDYGCHSSGACFAGCLGRDLLDAFEDHFRYSGNADYKDRVNYFIDVWWSWIKEQLNKNRPIPYRIPNHVIVVDGWQEMGSTRKYHINYGHNNSNTTWYTLDAIFGGNPDEEKMIVYLYPAGSLHNSLSGTYSRLSFPYRYFNVDATGSSAVFSPGQYLQFLQGITVTATGTPGIRIEGSTSAETRLFSRGDKSSGIRIYNGAIMLSHNGSIKLY